MSKETAGGEPNVKIYPEEGLFDIFEGLDREAKKIMPIEASDGVFSIGFLHKVATKKMVSLYGLPAGYRIACLDILGDTFHILPPPLHWFYRWGWYQAVCGALWWLRCRVMSIIPSKSEYEED